MRRFCDLEDTLKKADAEWRVANPGKAARLDPDTGNAELGAAYLKIVPWAADRLEKGTN
jgi:hypothetical protein